MKTQTPNGNNRHAGNIGPASRVLPSPKVANVARPFDCSKGQVRRLISGARVYGRNGCTSLSRTSVWRGVREGWFPSPVSVSPGRIAWFEDEIDEWLQSRPRLRSCSATSPH